MSSIKEEEEKKLDYRSWLFNTPNGHRLRMARAIHLRISGNLIDIRPTTRKTHEREIRELQQMNTQLILDRKLRQANQEIVDYVWESNGGGELLEIEEMNLLHPVSVFSSSSSSSSLPLASPPLSRS